MSKVEEILNSAKQFKEKQQQMGAAVTYMDYQKFKCEMDRAGIHGYESQLADILEI